ncbi:PAS domain-containing sensor histidine kinase [Cohnella sp. CFH 77786]|uniref:two-component system sensor histidine kinase NtrB n=1 Tax=Cohnella sp. CFH 77786 TaxID=2662265 RepID=UPI001C60C2F1|nr:ATP-binding protein [Cohnella sp. CFH 77786]MBW5448704.1 PAS domain-containing sensor histidine kinase [Cohnella sp. CFH 77786]
MNGPTRSRREKNASANGIDRRELREKYARLFADRFLVGGSTGVIIVDAGFRLMEMSEMVCRLFGSDRTEWFGRSLEEWFDAVGWKPYPFDRSLLRGSVFQNRAQAWGEGECRRWLMLDGDILEDGGGETGGAFVLLRDVSHLMLLEEQVRRSDRLKTIGQIAAGTAHEIRNPLTAIRGFMQLLDKSLMDRGMFKEHEYVGIMMSELNRVNELVSEFLLLSKPKEVRLASVPAGSVLQEILPVIRNEALLHGVAVRYEPKPGLPPIWVDKEPLKQVFLNLAKNAIEAMSKGGTLIIKERYRKERPDLLAVSVRDTGPGIPPDLLGRIFDPFFTTKPQGTGLGLSICQRIVHDLGGHLEVASGAGGTSFTVWLPLASDGDGS